MALIYFLYGPLLLLISPRYETIFTTGYDQALGYINEHRFEINQSLDQREGEKEVMLSVAFPELIRYSYLIDFFQETANEVIYIHYGKEKADFSIGHFQMKPSFVEKLEHYTKQSQSIDAKYNRVYRYSATDEIGIRTERIARLKRSDWQLFYLKCFYAVMNDRFGNLKWESRSDMIRFYSSAYNHNLEASFEEIDRFSKSEFFPYGKDYSKDQYSYSKISVYFYLHSWPDVKKDLEQ